MSLKTQNYPLIILYIIFNFAIFFVIYKNGSFDLNSFNTIFEKLSKKDGIFFIILPLLSIVLQGLISSKSKERLIFWKINNRLPSCQAFSKYMKEDNRIDKKNLIEKYGKLPKKENKQSQLWYKIYKNISDKAIDKTHKDYLLTRELTIITVFFIFIFPIILYFFTTIKNKILIIVMCLLIFEYLIMRYVSKNYAERLVVNVLAFESSKPSTTNIEAYI